MYTIFGGPWAPPLALKADFIVKVVALPSLHLNQCMFLVNQEVSPLDRADSLVLRFQEILLIIYCFKCYFKKVDEH